MTDSPRTVLLRVPVDEKGDPRLSDSMSHALALIEHNAPATDRFASCLAALWMALEAEEGLEP